MTTPGLQDRITLPDGGLYEVIGVDDHTYGFHQWQPGYVFPTPFTVAHEVAEVVAEDDLGNNSVIFAAAVPVPVISITPTTTEDLAGHASRSITDVDLYMPPGLVIKLKRVTG